MRVEKIVPLFFLAGTLLFVPLASPAGSKPARPQAKNTKADQPISKKESHMVDRDREMDKRMKQKSTPNK
jgi:hypothetical protein